MSSSSLLIHGIPQLQTGQLFSRPWRLHSPARRLLPRLLLSPSKRDLSLDSILSSIWNFTRRGLLFEALLAYSSLRRCYLSSHLLLHPVSSLLACCTELRAEPEGWQLHAHLVSLGSHRNPHLVSRLVAFYAGRGSFVDADAVAEGSNTTTCFAWNLLISAYVRAGFYWRAVATYKGMTKKGMIVDNFTYSSVLTACGEMLDMSLGQGMHARLEKSGLCKDLFVDNALIALYAKCGDQASAEKLLEGMLKRDVVSWNTIIAGYISKGLWEDASKFLEKMIVDQIQLNTVTWNTIIGGTLQMDNHTEALQLISHMKRNGSILDSVTVTIGLKACSRIGCLRLGKEIHGLALRSLFDGEIVMNALITMYSRCGEITSAKILFQTSRMRTSITWNCIISGYAVLDHLAEASSLFQDMIQFRYLPTAVTILTILTLCGRFANLHFGKEIHCYITKNGFYGQLSLYNSLIHTYCKCGKILEAWKIFDLMMEKDTISYTTMINGFGMHGEGRTAIALFMDMTQRGIKPDSLTMVVVLSACCHAGLLVEGEMLFCNMPCIYSIVPGLEHYSCMVSLYVRTGFLRKAEKLLNTMPIQPTVGMWASLVRACQVQHNPDIGARAATKLLNMKPDNLWYYVLVANMYAAASCWAELSEVKMLIRNLGFSFRDVPGCASMDLGARFYPYMAEDKVKECQDSIFTLLKQLSEHVEDYLCNEDPHFW